MGHYINYYIIKLSFLLSAIKVDIKGINQLKKREKYIFCANHSSYLDIACSFLVQYKYIKFVGKQSLEKIPLFGYMYKSLYITVNRKDKDSKKKVIEECKVALNEGCSLAIYPEGAIPHATPQMIPFKDGAFTLSVSQNVPIVPITLPHNHLILPVDKIKLTSRKIIIIIHEPLNTVEKPINNIKELKEKTYDVIENELKSYGVI